MLWSRGVLQTLWWVVVYHGADAITGAHGFRVRLHFDSELAIPFVPSALLVYHSLNLVFLPAPFILRSREEFQTLALSLAVVTLVAGIGFLLVPGEVAYAPADPGAWASLYDFSRRIVLRYNLFPSLHVAMSTHYNLFPSSWMVISAFNSGGTSAARVVRVSGA
jgi:hypothetical protein